ncbi:hypothetical protein BCR36DRAFT_336001 [Piromyces finnis]|uniref:Uncharacterized protein n=1 Tax=Piromyces finnis TaxID=1754191 RepID=A0A1Y1UY87_9FUNG|nr:hypothetical protein BCR36DRAFT_336001 [Piromyces finnis]|eukprot:ORX43383.1 hypothetical protein BCR36DRAFT_336001 [Piromyces finnis]
MDYNDDNEIVASSTTFHIDSSLANISSHSNTENNKINNYTNDDYQDNNEDENNSELLKIQLYARAIIVKAWKRYLDRKTFKILKNSLYEIRKLCTDEILRKLNPRESVLFNDPLSQGKVRFRFGGETFPPYIYYKIYSNGQNIHYFSGYRILNSFSDAYHDAYKLMGNRNFEKVINKDNVWNNSCDISDPSDVTNKKEYIQYMNSMDKKPIYLGGRNNGWRELSTLSISIPLYEKEICNIYERNKNIYSSVSLNNKIANRKIAAKSKNKINDNKEVKNNKTKNKRKIVKLMSEKRSNRQKQKERIKKMQQMYQFGKYEKEDKDIHNENKNLETEENEVRLTENNDSSSSYCSSIESDSENDEDIDENKSFNIDDIENDDFHDIYEWANELSFENSFNCDFSNMKI